MSILFLPLLIGIVAGLRALTAVAAVSLAASAGLISLVGTPLAFLAVQWTAWLVSALAVGELIADKMRAMPSRKVPAQFAARLLAGALAGGALGAHAGNLTSGLATGAIGAIIGTFGGAAGRARAARSFGSDRPGALIEDAAAVFGAVMIVTVA